MSNNQLKETKTHEEPTYMTDTAFSSNELLGLIDAGFSTEQIKLLIPFMDKISTLNHEGLVLLKSRLDENLFSSVAEDNSQYETHLDTTSDNTAKESEDPDVNYSEISVHKEESLPEGTDKPFGNLVEFSVNKSFEDISRQLAKAVALAVSKEINMHILSIKAEQDLRITALENIVQEYKSLLNSNNKPIFHRNSKKNRSNSACVPLTSFKTS